LRMNIKKLGDKMSYKIEILKAFLENQKLVAAMNHCYHSENQLYNPYHLEGSVWTHTMMVYNSVKDDDPISLIMALCHDIGKVAVRNVKEDGKVTFYGHADASIQPTIDFVDYLYSRNIIDVSTLIDFIKHGLPAVANHTLYYSNAERLHDIGNHDRTTVIYLHDMAYFDTMGSISKEGKIKDDIVYKTSGKAVFNPNLPTIKIWVGLPGTGKDFCAAKDGDIILSFDDIREEVYMGGVSAKVYSSFTKSDLYNEAFRYCNENKTDLMGILRKKVYDAVNSGSKLINICNTSLTRKSRKSLINSLGTSKFNFEVVQLIVPTSTIMKRNEDRTSKYVPEEVISRMAGHMTIVTHFEDSICDIKYMFNN